MTIDHGEILWEKLAPYWPVMDHTRIINTCMQDFRRDCTIPARGCVIITQELVEEAYWWQHRIQSYLWENASVQNITAFYWD